jgi:hypothetical protein
MAMADADRETTVTFEFHRVGPQLAAGLTRRRESNGPIWEADLREEPEAPSYFSSDELRGVLRLLPRLLGLGPER